MTNQLITHRLLIDYQLMSLIIDLLCLVLGIRQAFLPRDEILRTSAWEANSVAAIVLFGRLIKFCPYKF